VLATAIVIAGASPAFSQRLDIDSAKSTVTIRVFKSGLFSGLAHDHEIQAPIETGNVDLSEKAVGLTFNVADMKVVDPGVSDSERKDIDASMKGPKVLDMAQFPAISFTSNSVKAQGTDRNDVSGMLKIHGVSRPITLSVTLRDGKYTGSTTLKQTDYGITPIKIAGGTVRVKDEITIEFSIVPVAGGANRGAQ
jgi:polyisoprenoid-binding protein YceI